MDPTVAKMRMKGMKGNVGARNGLGTSSGREESGEAN